METSTTGTAWTAIAALVISGIALVQPWAIGAYNRFFRRRQLTFIPSGRVEIGFAFPFASHITLKGAIYSKNRSSLVRGMVLSITHEDSGATRILRAHVARDAKLIFGTGGITTSSEIWAPIYIQKDDVGSYYVTFVNFEHFTEMNPRLASRMAELWNNELAGKVLDMIKAVGPKPSEALEAMIWTAKAKAATDQMQSAFFSLAEPVRIASDIDSMFAWPPGMYRITLDCEVEGDARGYQEKWRFRLTESDETSLKANRDRILRELSGIQVQGFPTFVYPDYLAGEQ